MLNRKNLLAVSLALFFVALLALFAYRSDTRPGGPKDQMEALRQQTVVYEGIPSDQVPDSIPAPNEDSLRAAPVQTP
jgi:hypothetical protein